ncbi:MAG: hypothetical protein Q4D91_07450 [Lautropia sp.]|nr:hypothetical protein [Lautropia sp.]
MLIVIIAWLYVVLLMSLAEHSVAAGIMTFLWYGLLPLSVVVYLLNTPARRARKRRQANTAAQVDQDEAPVALAEEAPARATAGPATDSGPRDTRDGHGDQGR